MNRQTNRQTDGPIQSSTNKRFEKRAKNVETFSKFQPISINMKKSL